MILGISLLDNEHNYLLTLTGELDDMLKSNVEKGELVFKIAEVFYFAKSHFKDEEMLMQNAGWSGLQNHGRLHIDMKEKLTKLYSKVLSADTQELASEAATVLHEFLTTWLVRHIQNEDSQFAEFLKAKQTA